MSAVADRFRVTTGSHAPSRHTPGHVERFRGWYRVRPMPVRAAHCQRSADALDRAHVRRLQSVHVLLVLGDIHRAHGTPSAHDRRPFGRDAAVRLSQARLLGQVFLHRRTRPAHAGTPGTGRAGQREFVHMCAFRFYPEKMERILFYSFPRIYRRMIL